MLACALLEGSQENSISFVLDLTERKRVENELWKLYQQVQDLNRSLEYQVTERTAQLHEQMQQLKLRTAELAASKAQMQKVLDHIPAFIHIIDLDGQIKFANAKWQELSSQVEGSFVGDHISSVFTLEETEMFLRQNQTVALANQVLTFESEVVLPDGVHTFLDIKVPLAEPAGEVHAICGIALDLSDHKQMEAALRQSEQQLRAIVDNVPLGLFTSNSLGCQFVNQYWLSQMGLTLEEALGTGWMHTIHPEDREWVAREVIEAKKASRAAEAEFRFVDRDGNIHWMLSRTVPIRDENGQNGQVKFYQGFLVDITSRKQAEEELQKIHKELEIRVKERTAELALINKELLSENIERKQVEEAVRQSEERFRCLSACSPVGIFLTDILGHCTYTNPRCQVICGFTSEQALGEGWAQFVHPDDLSGVLTD